MKLLILCSIVLPSVLATSFGATSAVITAKDVTAGVTPSQLTPGALYRAYAVYASSAANDNYVSKIVIKGSDNSKFTVAQLAKPKANTAYVLDHLNIVKAPVTITDTNTPATGTIPYTIYLVSYDVSPSPVISAQLTNGQVDCTVAKLSSSSCTVLSAEMSILLSNVDVGSMKSVAVKTARFDSLSADNTVLVVTNQTPGSSVMVSGPIATFYSPDTPSSNFKFALNKEGKAWSGSLTPGASTSFLSDGWLSVWDSYKTDYVNQNTRTRSYDFGKDTQISFNTTQVGNYFPKNGDLNNYDSFNFTCTTADGKSTVYDCGDEGRVGIRCKKISINVSVGKKTNGGPRFNIQVDSVSGLAG